MPIPSSAATPHAPGELPRHHRHLIGSRSVSDEAEHPSGEALMDAANPDDEITPQDLATQLANGSRPILIDVREWFEWAIARLPNVRLVPLDSLPDAVPTLDRDSELVVYCHLGMRSAAAVAWLREQGFARARNLVGGIDRWSREVDPSTRRY
jgi:sulfur-carrier protein adenylyltransferase/sulfurtransferase